MTKTMLSLMIVMLMISSIALVAAEEPIPVSIDVAYLDILYASAGNAQAAFTASPITGEAPLTVTFTDQCVNPTGGQQVIQHRVWNFGDTDALTHVYDTDTEKNVSHTYTQAGTYQVLLLISNAGGNNKAYQTITVTAAEPEPEPDPIQPVADFSMTPESGEAPLEVQFTDSSVNASTYLWDFGDGNSSTEANPSNVYAAGTYTITLIVTSEDNLEDATTKVINVTEPVIPVEPVTANFSSTVTYLNANFTDLSTGEPAIFNWSFGDGETSTAKNPVHTYAAAGTYDVNLTVTKSGAPDSTVTKQVTVTEQPPSPLPVAGFTVNQTIGATPFTVQITDTSTNGVSYRYTFGDGCSSTERNPTHTYTTGAIYAIKQYVTNADNVTANYTFGVHPITALHSNFTFVENDGIITCTDTTAESPASWFWDFGDGTNSTLKNPVHGYMTTGTYNVTLTTSKPNVPSSTITKQVVVASIQPITADFTANKTSGVLSDGTGTIEFTYTGTGANSYTWSFPHQIKSGTGFAVTTYTTPHAETYTVTLTARDTIRGRVATVTKTNYITIT